MKTIKILLVLVSAILGQQALAWVDAGVEWPDGTYDEWVRYYNLRPADDGRECTGKPEGNPYDYGYGYYLYEGEELTIDTRHMAEDEEGVYTIHYYIDLESDMDQLSSRPAKYTILDDYGSTIRDKISSLGPNDITLRYGQYLILKPYRQEKICIQIDYGGTSGGQ